MAFRKPLEPILTASQDAPCFASRNSRMEDPVSRKTVTFDSSPFPSAPISDDDASVESENFNSISLAEEDATKELTSMSSPQLVGSSVLPLTASFDENSFMISVGGQGNSVMDSATRRDNAFGCPSSQRSKCVTFLQGRKGSTALRASFKFSPPALKPIDSSENNGSSIGSLNSHYVSKPIVITPLACSGKHARSNRDRASVTSSGALPSSLPQCSMEASELFTGFEAPGGSSVFDVDSKLNRRAVSVKSGRCPSIEKPPCSRQGSSTGVVALPPPVTECRTSLGRVVTEKKSPKKKPHKLAPFNRVEES